LEELKKWWEGLQELERDIEDLHELDV